VGDRFYLWVSGIVLGVVAGSMMERTTVNTRFHDAAYISAFTTALLLSVVAFWTKWRRR